MQNIVNKKFIYFVVLTFILSTVSLVIRNFMIFNFDNLDLKLIQIEHIKNYGAAFSMLQSHTMFLIIISVIILFLTLYYIVKNLNRFTKTDFFFCSLLTSGIICNLAERINDGCVTDYIKLNFVAFPIFNISDVFICIGAFVLICNILFSNEQKNNN